MAAFYHSIVGFSVLFSIWMAPQISRAAFEFSPVIASLTPSGPKSSASFLVTNPEATKVAIQVSIVAREPDQEGNEVYKDSDDIEEQFRIFPAQLVLNANETRTVRVSWIGGPKISSELAFRIIAEELPVDLSDPNKKYKTAVARIGIATKYIGSLYVTPPGASPRVSVDAKLSDNKTKPSLVLEVKNTGTAHQVIKDPIVKVRPSKGGNEIQLDLTQLRTMINQNILPGRTRRFELEWPKNLPPGSVKASLDLAKD